MANQIAVQTEQNQLWKIEQHQFNTFQIEEVLAFGPESEVKSYCRNAAGLSFLKAEYKPFEKANTFEWAVKQGTILDLTPLQMI